MDLTTAIFSTVKNYMNVPSVVDLYSPIRVWLENHGVNLDDTEDISKISDSIFISNISTTTNRNILKSYGITHILSVVSTMTPLYPDDFSYKHVVAYDNEEFNLTPEFTNCARYIQSVISSGGKILVHCVKGASRSVSIVMAYLIYVNYNNLSVIDLLRNIQAVRPIAHPNYGFINQLAKFDSVTNGRKYLFPIVNIK
jgi:protein-tyrosine phosphatase